MTNRKIKLEALKNIAPILNFLSPEGRSKEEEGRRFYVAEVACTPPKPLPSAHGRGLYPSVFERSKAEQEGRFL